MQQNEAADDSPNTWVSITYVGDGTVVPEAIWEMNQQIEYLSISLFLPQIFFQTEKKNHCGISL